MRPDDRDRSPGVRQDATQEGQERSVLRALCGLPGFGLGKLRHSVYGAEGLRRGDPLHRGLKPRHLLFHGGQFRQLLLDGQVARHQTRDLLLLLGNHLGLLLDCFVLLFESFDQKRNEIVIAHRFIARLIRGHGFGQHRFHILGDDANLIRT